jgi:antibiotic biosynthesis monooxygenase (ABM) superfamily enzyme
MRELLELKRDIDAFVAKFTGSMEQNVIAPLTSDIEA